MKKLFLSMLPLCALLSTSAQYKNDNVLFKTVYAEELCQALLENPGYLLLDVRSKGEYEDTSQSSSLNIGRMKGAKNIDTRSIGNRLNEISEYKSKPVFVYCSHSQRSRRVSKLLVDSGFTNVMNINGGMTTLHLGKANLFCKEMFETNNHYKLITPAGLCEKLRSSETVIIDIRSDSAYKGISSDAKSNARGKFNSAVHIPFTQLVSKINYDKNKNIILVDESGDQSAKAAELLYTNGYKNLSILFNGLDQWNATNTTDLPCKKTVWSNQVNYKMITIDELSDIMKNAQQVALIDLRSKDEFANVSKDSWKNIGMLKGAINIPASEFVSSSKQLTEYNDKKIVLYSVSTQPEIFNVASDLVKLGFKDVNVLIGGLFNVRWRAANIQGKSNLRELVVNIPQENL